MTRYILLLPLLSLLACAAPSMPDAPEGQALFQQNCTGCHGMDATGSAIAPDLTQISARHGGEFPRAAVLSQIDGYARGSLPTEVMPEFGALLDAENVPVEVDGTLTPTPRSLAALMVYLESIQTQP